MSLGNDGRPTVDGEIAPQNEYVCLSRATDSVSRTSACILLENKCAAVVCSPKMILEISSLIDGGQHVTVSRECKGALPDRRQPTRLLTKVI